MAVATRVGMALLGAVSSSSFARRVRVLPISTTTTHSFPSCCFQGVRRSSGRASSSSSSVSRAHSRRPPVRRPSRSSARKNDANKLSQKNDNENEEIVRAKEILGVVDLHAEADAGKRLADEEKKKNAFEEWLDEKLAARELSQTADGDGNWVQVDKARRKFYEKRRRRMYGSDSEDEKQGEDKYVELKPEIVEFPSFHAKQEELYFYDAFCFPWERDQHYRLIRKLEQKYYPHQGLENALIDPYEESQARTTKVAKEAEGEVTKPGKTKAAPILRNGRERTLAGNCRSVETKGKGDVAPKRISSESGDAATVQIDLNPKDIRQGLSQKKVQQFLKSLKHAPIFDGPSDMPYLLTKSSELPAKWDGPSGTAVLVDKPKGWTSFTVCGKLRRMVKVEKVGHAGTLDPMATGLLIVCVGKATKQVQRFQDMIKVYSGVFRLGEATSTWDADSPVIGREPWEHVKDDDIQKAVTSFFGEIWQVPPMFSAIKVGGEKMYDKARKGETIDLPPRRVSIYDFHVERSLEDRQNLIFKVTCSKGTYVRSLCADFGRTLGSCAHLTTLRREQIGDYSVVDAWKFTELEDAIIKHYI